MLHNAILKRVDDAETLLGKAPDIVKKTSEYTVALTYIAKIRQAREPGVEKEAEQIVYWLTRLYSLIAVAVDRHQK